MSSPGPEDKAKHELTEWLEQHGAKVYWEKSNEWGYPIFRIDDSEPAAQKPDLLIEFDRHNYAVEAKSGLSKSGIYDAQWELMEYWQRHIRNGSPYTVEGRKFPITGFLTATRWSIDGHLFDPTYESRIGPDEFGEGRNMAVDKGELPPTEFTMTEQHIRSLWRHRKRADPGRKSPGVGSLLSTALHQRQQDSPKPAVLISTTEYQDWRVYDAE